jgi:hypothetical protein
VKQITEKQMRFNADFKEIAIYKHFVARKSFLGASHRNGRKPLLIKKVLKQKKCKKRKRFEKRKQRNVSKSFKIFAANAAGIKCKTKSFDAIISSVRPSVFMLEETKLKPNEKIKCEVANDFQIFFILIDKSHRVVD